MNQYRSNHNYSTDPNQLVPLWEEMGSSTGGLIGRFIGLNFLMGARVLGAVLNPFGNRLSNYAGYPIGFSPSNLKRNDPPENKITSDYIKENSTDFSYYITLQLNEAEQDDVNKIIKKNNGIII